jgi:hypothetical protein
VTDGPLKEEDALLREVLDAPGGDALALPLLGDDELDKHARRSLRKEEREIAMRFHSGRMWVYAALTVGCFLVWVSLFPLAIMGLLGPLTASSPATKQCIRTSIRAGISITGRTS